MKCNPYLEKRCQSCQYLNLSYEDSVLKKLSHFEETFKNVDIKNKLPPVINQKIEGGRNKAKLSVALINEEIFFGIYDQTQKFNILMDCPLHLEGINNILAELKTLFLEFKIIPYQLKERKGECKSVIITKSDTTNEMMIRFVLRSKESLDRLKKMAIKLQLLNQAVKVCSANIQPIHAAILEGDEEIILTDSESINHIYDDFKIHLGVRSFFQVNSEIARKLYKSAEQLLKDKKIKNLLDLYCGVGAFSFYLSKSVENILGVEISEKAISYANITKRNHQIKNVVFKALDVDKFLFENQINADAVLVNPPRRGVGKKSIEAIKQLAPKYFIYSSCNAESLRNDFDLLKDQYFIESAQLFDMFPYSNHYEVLILMIRF